MGIGDWGLGIGRDWKGLELPFEEFDFAISDLRLPNDGFRLTISDLRLRFLILAISVLRLPLESSI
jgi:hypothetical protein